jgi:excisionase family DNA binding protein
MPIQKRFKKPVVTPPPISSGPRLLSIKDAAGYLGARVWSVRQMLRKRELPYVPVGRGFKIDKIDLDRWIEREKIGTGVAA